MTDVLARLAPVVADRYRVVRPLGAGGMATVVLADDLRHERQVAIKVLHPELSAVLGPERFLAEIRTTARLQHPHILPLFDSGEAGGLLYYVMPYVEGETLRARLERERQLPMEDALRIAREVADALGYAHAQGVIHRDVKPENILLRGGHALVADFGIALAVQHAGGSRLTQTGLSLGTPQYMSPEQATGERSIDTRADQYALGVVLYEMVAGEPPYTGPTTQAVIARLLTDRAAPLSTRRDTVPPAVERAVGRALEKLPADRFATVTEFARALTDPAEATTTTAPRRAERRPVRVAALVPWLVSAIAVAIAVASVTRGRPNGSPATDAPVVRLPFGIERETRVADVPAIPYAIAPDDGAIVYPSPTGSDWRLMLQRTDELAPRPISGTDGRPLSPVFSPDGRWVVYAEGRRVLRIPVEGGTPELLLNGDGISAGFAWLGGDSLVASIGGVLGVFPASGGTFQVLARPDTTRDVVALWGPHPLDARGERIGMIGVSPRGRASHRLLVLDRKTGRVRYAPRLANVLLGVVDDIVCWVTAGGRVQGVPLVALEDSTVAPVALLDGVYVGPGGAAKAALSARGSLVYTRGRQLSQLVAVDERGRTTPLSDERRAFGAARISPEGQRIAFTAQAGETNEVGLLDLRTGTVAPIASGGDGNTIAWFPDGQRLLYRQNEPGRSGLRVVPIDGSGAGATLHADESMDDGASVSPDGHHVVFSRLTARGERDLFVAPVTGDAPPQPLADTPAQEFAGRISRDGRWIAYAKDNGLWLTTFPTPGTRVYLTDGFGPIWSRDGRTLYLRRGRAFYAARLTLGAAPGLARLDSLFEGSFLGSNFVLGGDMLPDGRLLFIEPVLGDVRAVAILGWARQVRARFPTRPR